MEIDVNYHTGKGKHEEKNKYGQDEGKASDKIKVLKDNEKSKGEKVREIRGFLRKVRHMES